MNEPKTTHYIACGGLHGCISAHCDSHESYESAVESLIEFYELGKKRARTLRRDGYLELNLHRDGNEYCEVTECNCADPSCHNDD